MRLKITYIPIFLLFLSLTAHTAGFGGAEGKNKLGEVVLVGEAKGSDWGIYVKEPNSESQKEFSFNMECKWDWKATPLTFSCNPNGNSPLAGATYKVQTSKTEKNDCDQPRSLWVCIAGCNRPSVPQVFRIDPWEC